MATAGNEGTATVSARFVGVDEWERASPTDDGREAFREAEAEKCVIVGGWVAIGDGIDAFSESRGDPRVGLSGG